jgi:hypothetical protein
VGSRLVSRLAPSSALPLRAMPTRPIMQHQSRLHTAHTRITRIAGFERLRRDGISTTFAPRQTPRQRGMIAPS